MVMWNEARQASEWLQIARSSFSKGKSIRPSIRHDELVLSLSLTHTLIYTDCRTQRKRGADIIIIIISNTRVAHTVNYNIHIYKFIQLLGVLRWVIAIKHHNRTEVTHPTITIEDWCHHLVAFLSHTFSYIHIAVWEPFFTFCFFFFVLFCYSSCCVLSCVLCWLPFSNALLFY